MEWLESMAGSWSGWNPWLESICSFLAMEMGEEEEEEKGFLQMGLFGNKFSIILF